MGMAADATTAMTIDFLRARLLSERSVSRAAKERADHLARRVTELEEQLRTVTAQRRKAERAAAEVLAILDSQGFGGGRLSSDAADDSGGSEDEAGTGDTGDPDSGAAARDGGGGGNAAAEDALSGSEPPADAQAGGLSWRGRAASPECERRRPPPQQPHKGRQPRQRHGHGHGHRRGYFYSRAADSSPKYHPGQSCRKIKRKELRSQTGGEEEEGNGNAAGSTEDGQERSDCTVCADEPADFDGEARRDWRGCSGNGGVEDRDYRAMVYEKDGEMERVLEKQAELIGQFEAEENAQREWEEKFSMSRDSATDNFNSNNKLNQAENACGRKETARVVDKEVVCEQARSGDSNLHCINNPSECLQNGPVSELPQNVAKDSIIEQCKFDGFGNDCVVTTAAVIPSHGELQCRKDLLTTKSYPEGSGHNLGKSALPPQESCDSRLNADHRRAQGDENSDSGSSYHVNRSSERYINASSVGSPLSDTPKSEVSEWSSSCFHNHTDNQLDTQLHQFPNKDVGGVLEALQLAKMSLRAKLGWSSPPSQNILALQAPDDLPVNGMELSLSRSIPLSQEMLALATPADYLNRVLPHDDVKVPVGPAGLFRLPTDSFPRNEMASTDGYGSRFSLTSVSPPYVWSSYHANHIMPALSYSHYGSGLSLDPYYDPPSSMLLSMPAAGGRSVPVSDFRKGDGQEVPRPGNY